MPNRVICICGMVKTGEVNSPAIENMLNRDDESVCVGAPNGLGGKDRQKLTNVMALATWAMTILRG